jgi:hypothetical protein
MSISYKKIFTILSLIVWILMISFSFYLDKKEPDYDEIFIKKIFYEKFDSTELFKFSYPNPIDKKTPIEHRKLNNKYLKHLIDNDIKNIVLVPDFIQNMYKSVKKTNKTAISFSLNNEQFECAIARDFVLTPNEIDKQQVILVFSKNKKYLDYCHKYFFEAVIIYLTEYLEKYLSLTEDMNKIFTKSELMKYREIIITNENLREKHKVFFNKMIKMFQDSYEKDFEIINRIESRIFLLKYKYTIFFIFFPVYLLLFNAFLSNLKKEII